MADRKISDLTALTTPATGDLIPIVDISEAAAADKNKSITVQELFKGVPDGTAAAPGLAFESDDGNGIFLAGTDQVGVATGGVERVEFGASEVVFNDGGADYDFRIEGDTNTALFFVDASTDRVGVGTTIPSAPLEISNSVPIIRLTDSDGTNTYGQISASTATLTFAHRNNASNGQIVFQGLGGGVTDEYARFDTLGRLGIGTSSPSEVLDLRSTGTTRIFFESNDGGSPEYRATVGVDSGGFKIQTRDGTYGSNTDRLTIDTSGRVGIGTTSPVRTLHVQGDARVGPSGGQYILLAGDSSKNSIISRDGVSGTSGHPLAFSTGTGASSESMRIDSSGRLLVGTSSVSGDFGAVVSTGGTARVLLARESLPTSAGGLGSLGWGRNNGEVGATIGGIADANWTSGSSYPTRLVFSTTADGASSPTERMRIDRDGRLYLRSPGQPSTHQARFACY